MPLNFVSPGASARNAIVEELMRRQALERQAQLDAQARAEQEAAIRQRDAEIAARNDDLAFRREQAAREAAAQAEINKSLIDQREYTQVKGMIDEARPDDSDLAPEAVAAVERQGFGSKLQRIPGVVSQGPMQEEPSEANGYVPTYSVSQAPGRTRLQPGAKYTDAEAQRTFMEGQANLNRIAAGERAAAEREMRQMISTIAAQGNAQARALDARLKELQIAGLEDKNEAANAERTRAEATRTNDAQNAIEMLNRLENHPGLEKATGAYELRGLTQDARSWRAMANSVVAALALPNMSSLKGPASDRDVAFIKEKSTILQNPNISAEDARQAIRDAREFLKTGRIPEASVPPAGQPGAGGAVRVYYDGNGNPVRR